MHNCKICSQIVYDGNKTLLGYEHRCPPEWLVIDSNNSTLNEWQHAREFRGYDFDDAAIAAAEYYDNDEGPSKRIIQVKCPRTEKVKTFNIDFEYSVNYRAYNSKPDGEGKL